MRFRVGENKKQVQHGAHYAITSTKMAANVSILAKKWMLIFFNALYNRIINVDPNILREIKLHGSRYNDTHSIIEVKEQILKKQKRALDKPT
ncbi:hypothetical protein [Paenibacillus terrigena]|uniref:hypothetical protein n=1 Tax=Paenibacillus terrigena TaxID=369333 RepID=UPI00037EAB77|nr:hypothetical protein [Paenibacillus terrigena]